MSGSDIGGLATVTDALGARTLGYTTTLLPQTESIASGGLYDRLIMRVHDTTTGVDERDGIRHARGNHGNGPKSIRRLAANTSGNRYREFPFPPNP